jgi:hypothetical protein
MRASVRVLLAAIVVAGCSFEHAERPGGGGAVDDPFPIDAPAVAPVVCKYDDDALRLCVEFADGNYSDATDGARYHMNPVTQDVLQGLRGTQNAAITGVTSKLEVPEHPMLDIAAAITFEAFMAVPTVAGYHSSKLLDNDSQYELKLESDGKVTCRVGGIVATTDNAIGKDTWRHVACVYDGSSLVVFVSGSTSKSQSGSGLIPITGSNGTKLVNEFTGLIDDLRVYARALTASEICTHADKSACP